MPQKTCSCQKDIMLLSCSGASNLGQLANQAVVELTCEGFGKMFCLAGIGAQIGSYVQSVKDKEEMVVIDGCEKACGLKILSKNGIEPENHVIVSKLGIEKNDRLDINTDDLAKVKHKIKRCFSYPITFTFSSPKPLSPGDRARSRTLGDRCC
jgi:uncharacterized metal-binding protein